MYSAKYKSVSTQSALNACWLHGNILKYLSLVDFGSNSFIHIASAAGAGEGGGAAGAQVQRLDRGLYLGVAIHLPADVDRQERVRRVRPLHRPPQVLLRAPLLPRRCPGRGVLCPELALLGPMGGGPCVQNRLCFGMLPGAYNRLCSV